MTIRDAAHRAEGELAGRKHDEGTRERTSPWKLGGLGVGQLTKRVGSEIQKDDVLGRSAELAYYFFLALFPLLFFVVSIFGLVAHNNPQFRLQMMNYIRTMLPPDASSLLSKTLEQILRASSGTKLILGLLGALWTGSVGIAAVMEMCNITYDVKDQRPFWKSRGLAILLTIACSILMVAALGLILYGPTLADAVFGKNPVVAWTWKIVQWPVAVLFVLATFALIYYFGPDVEHPKWHWITPGSAVGVLLWLAGSFAFRVYLHFFNTYSATYGSLGAVIILLTWLYLTGAAVMIGSEINAEIEHAAAEHGSPEAKAEGEKVPPTKAA